MINNMDVSSEMNNFCKAWLTIVASLTYSYYLPRNLPTPKLRFLSLLRFISLASLPIKLKPHNKSSHPHQGLNSPLNYALKLLLLSLIIRLYDYKPHLHQNVILAIYCAHVYLSAEIILAMVAAPARAMLRIEIEPQFDEPYLSTSLQDFWGRRWNLMVPSVLRATVYQPVRSISGAVTGKRWGLVLGVLASFLVSGLMHELIYYYLTRVEPTWEVTWFFVLHGVCTSGEIVVKSKLGAKWRVNRVVSGVVTLGFLMGSSFWLFFPQLVRNRVDVRAIGEYGILVEFVKGLVLRPLRLI